MEAQEIQATPATAGGTCRSCGCTDNNPCPGGCCWVNETHDLCSACVDGELCDGAPGPVCRSVAERMVEAIEEESGEGRLPEITRKNVIEILTNAVFTAAMATIEMAEREADPDQDLSLLGDDSGVKIDPEEKTIRCAACQKILWTPLLEGVRTIQEEVERHRGECAGRPLRDILAEVPPGVTFSVDEATEKRMAEEGLLWIPPGKATP